MKRLLILSCLAWLSSAAHAQTASDIAEVQTLLQNESSLSDLNSRLELVSKTFLGRPYLNGGPLGEGLSGVYDQDPLYRTDGFDCTTFVETTMAIARSFHLNDFLDQLNHIRYQGGVIDFTLRNHFVEIDWNPNNEAAGFLKDITLDISHLSQTADAVQTISKRAWYQAMTLKDLKLIQATPDVLNARLLQLQGEGQRFSDTISHLPYLKKEFILRVLASVKTPAVLNIVRDVKGSDGKIVTMVTHQVLFLIVNGKPRVRQASSKTSTMKVIDQSLEEFAQAQIESTTTRGINILKILNR